MKRIALLALASALALMAFGMLGFSGGAYAQGSSLTITLSEQNASGQNGTATLTDMGGGQLMVVINISGGSSTPQPAHIHPGTCADLNPRPTYPLSNVVNGASETTVNANLGDLLAGTFAINVHKSVPEASVYIACGDIRANVVGMPATGVPDSLLAAGAFALLAVLLAGAGLELARRRA